MPALISVKGQMVINADSLAHMTRGMKCMCTLLLQH